MGAGDVTNSAKDQADAAEGPRLAPSPDFRYVGLTTAPILPRGLLTYVGLAASAGASVGAWLGPRGGIAFAVATAAGLGLVVSRSGRRSRLPPGRAVPLTVVPWGILVESEGEQRVLHWGAIQRVHLEMGYGREGGTPLALFSVVTIETAHERLAARAPGAVPLEGLMVHLQAYAEEASHLIALDLGEPRPLLTAHEGGRRPITETEDCGPRVAAPLGAGEARCESLLAAARAYVRSASAASRLGLAPGGYRTVASRTATSRAVDVLGAVLRDRRVQPVDPRPFAAVVAAELGAAEVLSELVPLVQSPHPVVAAVCKVAARRLGAGARRTGSLDEVAPFLRARDVDVLAAWQASG